MRHVSRRALSFLAFAAGALASTTVHAVEPPPTGVVPAGQFRLGYRIEGNGPTALVIGSCVYYPRVFSQELRKRLRLVFLDHRGFVKAPATPAPKGEFALDTLVDDVERARQQLGLGRVIVVGHSGHAYMALEYAKKYPANVSHVVLIGISPDLSPKSDAERERYWSESVWPERKAALQENMKRLPEAELEKLVHTEKFVRGYVRDGPRAWYDPRFDSTPLWAGVDVNMDMFDHVWGELFRDIDVTRGLETFDRPVLLALGRYDFLIAPPSAWDSVRPKFRDLTVRVFEHSGHTPQHDEPKLFDDELMGWIAAHP